MDNRININYSIDVNGQYVNNKTTYHRPLSSEIYEIAGDTVRMKYLLDFKGEGLPANFAKVCNGSFDVFERDYLNAYSFLLGKYLETDNYLIMRITGAINPMLFDGIDKYPSQKKKLINNANINIGDNPIIYVLKLK